MTPTTHRQLSGHLGMPADFYDRLHASSTDLRDPYDPDRSLFEATLNALLRARPADERRLVRTLDGNARVSQRSLTAARPRRDPRARAPVPRRFDLDWNDSSLEVTEHRLYMKLVHPRVQADVRPGDAVQAGVVVTNSEVGLGS